MVKVALDPQLQSRLEGVLEEVELTDASGRTLGYFVPPERHHELLYTWARSQVTSEELERARKQPGGRTLSEILADLAQ